MDGTYARTRFVWFQVGKRVVLSNSTLFILPRLASLPEDACRFAEVDNGVFRAEQSSGATLLAVVVLLACACARQRAAEWNSAASSDGVRVCGSVDWDVEWRFVGTPVLFWDAMGL